MVDWLFLSQNFGPVSRPESETGGETGSETGSETSHLVKLSLPDILLLTGSSRGRTALYSCKS